MMTVATNGHFERRRCSKIDPWDGGFTRGSVVARPQRKQMSALPAISVWQYLQFMNDVSALGSRLTVAERW
jgi:hypothetical protein